MKLTISLQTITDCTTFMSCTTRKVVKWNVPGKDLPEQIRISSFHTAAFLSLFFLMGHQ